MQTNLKKAKVDGRVTTVMKPEEVLKNPNMQNKQHDDFPDSLAGMLNNVLNGTNNVAKVYDASRFGV